jgi:hypothetical protein
LLLCMAVVQLHAIRKARSVPWCQAVTYPTFKFNFMKLTKRFLRIEQLTGARGSVMVRHYDTSRKVAGSRLDEVNL